MVATEQVSQQAVLTLKLLNSQQSVSKVLDLARQTG